MCVYVAASGITGDHQMPDGSHAITSSPLMIIESFLAALTNADQDGRIVIAKKQGSLYVPPTGIGTREAPDIIRT